MAALPPASERRRARPGSLARPVNGRLYRGTWLLVGLPLLVLAFSVARPAALQPPALPPAFDATAAAGLAQQLATAYPIRAAGSPAAAGAARWVAGQLQPYGYDVRREPFRAEIPGRGPIRGVNLLAGRRGLSTKTIVVLAHRDDAGTGPGTNDNASGTAALVELARAYAPSATGARVVRLPYTLLFLSTDAAVDGGAGAAWFAAHAPERLNVIAVLDLDAIAGGGRPRLELNGDTPRTANAGLAETVRLQLAAQTGSDPTRASALRQLVDLAFPYSRYEQAPFVSRGIPAVTITTAPDRPGNGLGESGRLHVGRLGQIGRAAQNTIDALQQGVALSPGPGSYVFLGTRIVRGWAIELVLIGCLLPFLAAAVDLFARCRRRRIRVAPALRAYRSRLAFWAWCGILFALFGVLGAWPGGIARPPSLRDVAWPGGALVGLGALAFLGWLVARDRLIPRREVGDEELLAGQTAALLALGVVALLVVATNPYALIFFLPSLHLWLWLPQLRDAPRWVQGVVLAAGFAGAGLLLWSFGGRYGLGWDAPWYVAWLFALGYAPPVALVIGLGWLAAAGQLVAAVGGRYAPYPAAAERPPRGPLRELVRTVVLARRRRREPEAARRALHG